MCLRKVNLGIKKDPHPKQIEKPIKPMEILFVVSVLYVLCGFFTSSFSVFHLRLTNFCNVSIFK